MESGKDCGKVGSADSPLISAESESVAEAKKMRRGGPERHINSGKMNIHIPLQSANGQDQILKDRGQGTPAEQNN